MSPFACAEPALKVAPIQLRSLVVTTIVYFSDIYVAMAVIASHIRQLGRVVMRLYRLYYLGE